MDRKQARPGAGGAARLARVGMPLDVHYGPARGALDKGPAYAAIACGSSGPERVNLGVARLPANRSAKLVALASCHACAGARRLRPGAIVGAGETSAVGGYDRRAHLLLGARAIHGAKSIHASIKAAAGSGEIALP